MKTDEDVIMILNEVVAELLVNIYPKLYCKYTVI